MISEELVTVTQALMESEALREWVLGLEELPVELRAQALEELCGRMRSGGAEEALVGALGRLREPGVFAAVVRLVREGR